ncbi:Hypothetical predicted protein [Mytilus galloprovincialis]|uniref:Uncharacterized protein n=1 Tax=Mytilus galloprovincialis TaxID=29158 RepID=A0A8B6CS55_MYTGA|nr:Hypothetical predicted protein [Mytilus galloprovincialis]
MKITFSPKVKSVEALKLRERQRSKLCIDQVSTSRSSVRGSLTRVTDISTFINDFTTSNLSDLSITPADCKTTCSNSSIKKITTEDGSKNGYRKEPVRRMLPFVASYPPKKTQTNCYSRFKTEPIANSTMIDILDNTAVVCSLSCKPNEFAPSAQSTMLHEWLPCASSTAMKKSREQFEESTCYSFTDVETWSINEGEETCVIYDNYLGRHQYERESTCYSRDFLSTITASTICRDEFSLDGYHQQEQFIMDEYHHLPRTSTEAHLNNKKLDHGSASEKPLQTKEAFKKHKQHPKLFKLMQVMKNVKKGLTKKTKNDNDQKKFVEQEPVVQSVQIQNKQAVVRNLRRFRESFRRKDSRQLQTLAML